MRGKLVLAAFIAAVGTMGMTVASAHAAPSAKASTKKFCDLNWKVSEVFNSIPDEPTAAQTAKIEAKINGLLEDAEAVVPTEVAPQVAAASASLRQGLAAAFQDPTLQENAAAIDAWVAEHCDFQVVDVHTTEYHFDGIPKTLKPGRTIFRLTNDGAEVHELGVAPVGKNATVEKLIARAQHGGIDLAGGTFAAQGDEGYAYVALKKGRYAALCFVPVGSVDPNTRIEGEPHASRGMAETFTVS